MSLLHRPEVGQWYKNLETGDIFEIVALDELDSFIETQHFTGEIEGIDWDSWNELALLPIPEPEDLSGPFELTKEDNMYSDDYYQPENWSGPFADLESIETEEWY